MEKIKMKASRFHCPPSYSFYGTGMLDRERELRDFRVPEFPELGRAHKQRTVSPAFS